MPANDACQYHAGGLEIAGMARSYRRIVLNQATS
jgi:hypothetical protein